MSPTVYIFAADVVVVLHMAFVLFVVIGGAIGIWRPQILWFHLPALLWGVWVECTGWICPLTPLENVLRQRGGGAEYSGSFIEHLILPVLYPEGLTPAIQLVLGGGVLLVNGIVYWAIIHRHRIHRNRSLRRGK